MIQLYREGITEGSPNWWKKDGITYSCCCFSMDDQELQALLDEGWFRSFEELKAHIEERDKPNQQEIDPQVKMNDPFAGWQKSHYQQYLTQNNVTDFNSKTTLPELEALALNIYTAGNTVMVGDNPEA